MKVLVTGGAGFIGSNLCRRLCEAGPVAAVTAYDDLSTGLESNLRGLDIELVRDDIRSSAALARAARGVTSIVHLAARPSVARSLVDPVATNSVNVDGTLSVLNVARAEGAQVIFASSSSVYGDVTSELKHEDLPTRPKSPYGASKLAAEAYCLAYGHSYELPVLALRFFNVYGPYQRPDHTYAAVIPKFIHAALHGGPIPIEGDGRQSRDFTFIDSVTDVITKAIVRGTGESLPVNLAFGTRTTIADLAKIVCSRSEGAEVRYGPPRTGDIRESRADSARLLGLFPDAEVTPLRVGLAKTYDWMRDEDGAALGTR